MTNKKVQKNQEICGIFDTLNEPEISTIALIQMTADAAKVSYDRVVQALSWRNKNREKQNERTEAAKK
jgi:hypothetical protein